jgi:hypothetical protein
MNDDVLRVGSLQTEAEPMPSLSDVADEPGEGAWPLGWYRATILPGFTSRTGRAFQTEDTLSKAGDSRNLTITLNIKRDGRDQTGRNMFTSRNYRIEDLTAANVERIKSGDADQRLRISLGKLGQIEKAVGQAFKRHPDGYLIAGSLVGRQVDVRLGMDKADKYNEVTAFAPAGTKAK